MSRRPVLVVVAALVAALAFGTGATVVADLGTLPTVQDGLGETTNASNVTAGSGGSSGPGGPGVSGPVGGVYGLVAGLLPAVSPTVLLVVTGLVVLGLALVGLGRRDAGTPATGGPEETAAVRRDDAGAGTEAHVPDAPADNGVYRAWRRMVAAVGPEYDETTTPREFAREAVQAGANADAVERVTDLFDRVRYGDAEPTAEREAAAREAVAALDDGGAER